MALAVRPPLPQRPGAANGTGNDSVFQRKDTKGSPERLNAELEIPDLVCFVPGRSGGNSDIKEPHEDWPVSSAALEEK